MTFQTYFQIFYECCICYTRKRKWYSLPSSASYQHILFVATNLVFKNVVSRLGKSISFFCHPECYIWCDLNVVLCLSLFSEVICHFSVNWTCIHNSSWQPSLCHKVDFEFQTIKQQHYLYLATILYERLKRSENDMLSNETFFNNSFSWIKESKMKHDLPFRCWHIKCWYADRAHVNNFSDKEIWGRLLTSRIGTKM